MTFNESEKKTKIENKLKSTLEHAVRDKPQNKMRQHLSEIGIRRLFSFHWIFALRESWTQKVSVSNSFSYFCFHFSILLRSDSLARGADVPRSERSKSEERSVRKFAGRHIDCQSERL